MEWQQPSSDAGYGAMLSPVRPSLCLPLNLYNGRHAPSPHSRDAPVPHALEVDACPPPDPPAGDAELAE